MLDRRARRLGKLARLLQSAGLLPEGDLSTSESRHAFFQKLDAAIFPENARRETPHTLLYGLRARALDEAITCHELGRAIYHLAQRRGFLSNRVTKEVEEETGENEGKVKEGIAKLSAEMQATGARTLGEYFARLDPEKERIRKRWTSRQMHLDEFEAIWQAQREHHGDLLADSLKKTIHRAIFFQRPLKWDRSTIGTCELELGKKRAPWALLDAQRYRFLQKVNDLRLLGADPKTGEMWPSEKLDEDRRAKLVNALESEGDLTFAAIKKLLALPKWITFNQEGGESKLIGNRTASKLRAVFGPRWSEMSSEEKDRAVEDLRSIRSEKALRGRAERFWHLDAEAALAFSRIVLESDYCSLSRQALKKLLPLMEKGVPYATARKELYGDRPAPEPFTFLPSLDKAPLSPIRNPAVLRALSETRKVVNGIIRQYGKPAFIRVELARDLKRGRKERQVIWKENQANRKKREEAGRRLLEEHGIAHPSRQDIEKWLLADECGWRCPYTGLTISGDQLFGPTPQFDVEHIIPFSRLLDDSFLNKTLCQMDENRHVKQNRTPWEAYGHNPEKWDGILQRVKQFNGPAKTEKLRRFQLDSLDSLDDFTNNQLSDTRYASKLAIEYLALLYGTGAQGVDADHTRRVQVGRGGVTKYLRDEWGLNRILGDGSGKSRDDHRHHAVDAVCIALTDARAVQMLSKAASSALQEGRRRFGKTAPPWPGFYDQARGLIEKTVVSHRPARKVSGPLHEETFYSPPKENGRAQPAVHLRKPLNKLSKNEVAAIVDPKVREIVSAALNGGDPKKVFAEPSTHPRMESGVPIHAVRIRKAERTEAIGSAGRQRHVMTGSNHHVEIFARMDRKGGIIWDGVVVTLFEAMRRIRAGEPVICRDHGPDCTFLFSLCQGDLIEIDGKNGRELLVVRIITTSNQKGRSYPSLSFAGHRDARLKKEIIENGAWLRSLLDPLRKLNCRKVSVTPLGEVRYAND
jgi:CRISPR-associated endonuclease Csn1